MEIIITSIVIALICWYEKIFKTMKITSIAFLIIMAASYYIEIYIIKLGQGGIMVAAGLILLSIIDARTKMVSDYINLSLIYLLVIILAVEGDIQQIANGLAVIGGILILGYTLENIYKERKIGEGDYPIHGSLAMLLLPTEIITWIIMLPIVGIIYMLITYILEKKKEMAYIPVLVISFLITKTWGETIETIINTYILN